MQPISSWNGLSVQLDADESIGERYLLNSQPECTSWCKTEAGRSRPEAGGQQGSKSCPQKALGFCALFSRTQLFPEDLQKANQHLPNDRKCWTHFMENPGWNLGLCALKIIWMNITNNEYNNEDNGALPGSYQRSHRSCITELCWDDLLHFEHLACLCTKWWFWTLLIHLVGSNLVLECCCI